MMAGQGQLSQRAPGSTESLRTYASIQTVRRRRISVHRIGGDCHLVGGVPLSTELLHSVARGLALESSSKEKGRDAFAEPGQLGLGNATQGHARLCDVGGFR